MEARELRIGNYILFGDEIVEVESIALNKGVCNIYFHSIQSTTNSTFPIDLFEPIPLTEEILLKCGFECIEKDNSGGDYRHRNYKWFQFFFNSKSILKYGAFTQLIHLHQLQNLIYALTGEELDIDLSR